MQRLNPEAVLAFFALLSGIPGGCNQPNSSTKAAQR